MYFKDNGKTGKCSYFADGYNFQYYEFSDRQKWLELGQSLQCLLVLHKRVKEILDDLERKHGKMMIENYDKATGFISGHTKPIKDLIDPDEIGFISRLIEEVFNHDLKLITRIESNFAKLRPYQNLMENLKIYSSGDGHVNRELINKHFDFITLNSLQSDLLEFWNLARKALDDTTNEIIIPEPTIENREMYNYFLDARDNYCNGNKESALFCIRKGLEDILTKLWILSYPQLHDVKWEARDKLENMPGLLLSKGALTDTEMRECMPLVKYGNSASHVKGEVSSQDLSNNCKTMINSGIMLINKLSTKYIQTLTNKKYCKIEFSKTGFYVTTGNLYDYIAKGGSRKS